MFKGSVPPQAGVKGAQGPYAVHHGLPQGAGVMVAMRERKAPWDVVSHKEGAAEVVEAAEVYDDGESRQLFPVEIDPAMDRYLRQKGEGWQADAYRSWQRGKMLAADLRKGGDDPMRTEKERVLGEERAKVQEYINERTRRGMPLFDDALAFKSAQEDEAEYARRKDKVDWHRSVFCGDLKKIPEGLKKRFAERKLPDGEIGDEMRYRSIVFGWALNEGGYAKWQVEAGNGVPVLEQMCIRLKEQGEQVDFNKPGQTVYMFLSRQAQKDAQADELLKGAAESVRQAVLTGGDGRQALWEQRGQLGEEMYKKVGNTLRWVKADAERTRRGLEPVLPRVMEGLEWAVKYADGTANRIFQPEGMASIHQALKAMDGLTDAQMDALAEIVQRKGGNEGSYMANVWKAGNRGWEDLGNGIRSLLRGGIAAQLDVAGGVKELFGGDGSALKADAKAADEYGRRLDAFLAMAQGTYRPINKPEYGWFGNGVLSAVRSVPITALSFSGVGAGVVAMSYAGDSYSKAVQERPDGGRLARLGGAAASGAVQGALDRAGAIVAKGVMGLRSGSAFVDKWMSKLSLSRQAMRLKSSALRAGARSGVAGGMVLGEEMTTEKLQDLADPVMQSLASVMAGEAPGIDWERFWKDFKDLDQNMELFGSVLAFALVGAGARFTAEAGMQRQLSREYGKLKRTFGFSDSLLARMRAEESDVARYAMMQDGIQDFMRRNYGKEVDGVKVGLGDRDGMRKLAARGGVRTMDVVAAAEAHAAETARGVDEVRVDGAEVQDGQTITVEAARGAVTWDKDGNPVQGVDGGRLEAVIGGGVSEVGSGPVLSFEHGPVPERKGRRQVDEKEEQRERVEAAMEMLKEFGVSPIREEKNEFTEEMQYVVELGDRPEIFDEYEDAFKAVLGHLEEREDEVVDGMKLRMRKYEDAHGDGYVGKVQDEANEEMMQYLDDVGQDEQMRFDRSKMNVAMTLAMMKNRSESMRKSAESRERIFAAQMGEMVGVGGDDLRLLGSNTVREFANGRYEVVSSLYRGANPLDVYEEWTEGMTKVLIRNSEWTVAEFEDELMRLEKATGERFLATGEGVDRLQAVCEGVSKAARAHLLGHISDERLPDKLRRWFKMFVLLFERYVTYVGELTTARKMLSADVQGQMSGKFRRLLNDFAGFDEAAIAERARRAEQAQIEAEAMGDVPEIGEWVAGRLPHPKTAAEAGSDLTGELQRIYDALTTTRTAKGRRRKDGTLGKGFEQRVVARAEQFFSRDGRVSDVLEAANEAGFDFADSGELLSAVYDSVVYGYKRYAARGEGQEVSFSMGDRVRRVPMEEARRVADAFHRVEGMEPVAADVPAAYASDLKDALGDIRERYRVLQKETQEQGYALVMGDGKRVQVGGKGWREVKQHAADRRVLAALAVLPELAGRAEFIYSGENSDLERKPNIARFHYYLTKADFKGASGDGSADLAYVNIAVAEGKNGELFYDLDASTVEDVDSMKGTSATLQRPRVPNTGEAGDGVPHKGRVALLKEFVNYVDRDLAGQGREGREVSVQNVEAQGGFDEHGVLAAENAVVVKPEGDVTMSVRALHASPHSFRKFSTDFMGKGEGAQAYGWGLYFAENPKVNRSYMNQFAQDKATWKFREVETGVIEVMQRSLVGSFLPKDALPEAKEDASDIAWSVLGDLVDAARGSMTVLDIVMELHDEIDTNRKYAETYPQEREKLEQLEGFMLSLLDHLDEIEVRTGMPSNYRVELNVEDSELLGWDYVDETVLALLKDSPVEEVRYALERAERRADYRGENVSGKDVYQELFDAFWDGEDGTKQEAQKAASVSLLSSDIKGIRYADGFSRNKAEDEQTYNYVIFDGNDIKITAYADESTGGAWADYVDGSATFSIREKADIKKKAETEGTFMKAPNGKDTNLTEDQWLSVRTAAFKNWFGDWEHDPENASKVVDKNGEPLVVYHGTYGDFTVFDKAKIGSATDYGIWGRGFYFTNMENTPYGNKKLALFLNIRNPFIFNDYKSAEEIGDYLNIWDGNFHEDDRFGIFRPYATGAAQIADSAQERGHDGLIAVLGKWTEYIAFEPNQIKSSTDNRGTFDPKNPDITFSVRRSGSVKSVWSYLAEIQGQAYEQEARLYEAMQKRLESALQANGFTRDGVYKDEQGRDDEAVRERMLAVMAVCDAVVTELPRDVRGGIRPEVVASYREEVMEKKTWRGRMNALMRMVKYVDWHIVNEGKKSRFKEFERFRKWAAASVGENRVRRGKMNAEIQRKMDKVEEVLDMDADELETAKNTAEKVVEEKALIGGAEYDEAVEWVRILDAFGGLYERNTHGRLTADLDRIQGALDTVKELYTAGRLANVAFWEERREFIADLLEDAGKGLGREQPVNVNERSGAAKHDVGVGKRMRNLVRGFVSFENLLEDLFGEGKVTKYFAESIRKDRLNYNDDIQKRVKRFYGALYRIARPEEFLKRADRKVDGQIKLGVRRVVDSMLKELSERRVWGIEVKTPGEMKSERVRIEEARAVAEGRLKGDEMPKWAKNQKAVDAMKMALSDIPAKSRKEFVKFVWKEQSAELVELELSDLEVMQLIKMAEYSDYEDNLDLLGVDAEAILKMRDHVDVRAFRIADYLGDEYERGYKEYNEVHRRLLGCDMPKIRNYVPAFFVTDNAAEAVDPMESRGSGGLSVGSIKMRRKHYKLPCVVSLVHAYWAHSMQMDHWVNFAETVRDMKAVLLNGELGNKIEAVYGAQARKLLKDWVKDLEFDGAQDSGGAGQAQQVVKRVLGAMAQGALSYNLKTCLKQLPAMFSSMADMSPSDAMKGFIGALANPGQLAEVWQSPTIQQRLMQGMSPEMRQALTANRMKVSMLGDAVEAGMLPIGLTDAAFTTFSGGIAYMAAKKKAMKEGLSDEVVEQRALAALDKAVRRTAQPIETEQKSHWEIHANALGRMFMMFRSDPRKQLALTYMAFAKWRRGEIGIAEAMWRAGNAWVGYGVLSYVIVDFLKWVMGQDDDEEELDLWDRWQGYVASGAMGALSGVYGLAEVIEFFYSKLAGEKYMKFSNTMVDHAEALWRGGEGVVRMYNGEEEEYGKVMNQLGRGLNGMGLFAAAGRPEIGAAVQVMGRIVKETKSMAGTWGHLWDNEMAKAREQQRLIQATKKEEKEARKAKMEERKELMARVKGLDLASRLRVYQEAGLDKDERKLMENRVKMDGASEVVKAVSRVKKDKRKELVEKLKGTMSDVEYEEFVTELKEKGVKWK